MAARGHYDLIIRNATIVDSTRAPRCAREGGADVELDAAGHVAAPGFIDAHTHDDRLLLSDPAMTPKASQGVTTVITGNCGISLAHSPARRRGEVTPPLDLLDGDGD